jgi:hypothetical protein
VQRLTSGCKQTHSTCRPDRRVTHRCSEGGPTRSLCPADSGPSQIFTSLIGSRSSMSGTPRREVPTWTAAPGEMVGASARRSADCPPFSSRLHFPGARGLAVCGQPAGTWSVVESSSFHQPEPISNAKSKPYDLVLRQGAAMRDWPTERIEICHHTLYRLGTGEHRPE